VSNNTEMPKKKDSESTARKMDKRGENILIAIIILMTWEYSN